MSGNKVNDIKPYNYANPNHAIMIPMCIKRFNGKPSGGTNPSMKPFTIYMSSKSFI